MRPSFLVLFILFSSVQASPAKKDISWLSKYPLEWKAQNPGKIYSLQRDSTIKRHLEDSLRFELRQGETWMSDAGDKSFRSEINTGDQAPMGSEKFYGFSLLLPKDFPIENNRLVLAQWWPLTKKLLGEVNRSPVLQLRFAAGRMSIRLRLNDKKITKDSTDFIETILFEKRKFALGDWNDFVFQIKWSPNKDGFINVWWNGKQVVKFVGQTEYQDDVGPKFKFGLYRKDTSKTYISYMSEVRMGNSFQEVDPSLAH